MRIENSDLPIPVIRTQQLNNSTKEQRQTTDQSETMQPAYKKADVELVVEKFNDFIQPLQTNLKFKFHEELNEYYVEVVDPITNETVREIPPKKMLDMYAAMAEFMGILVDKKV